MRILSAVEAKGSLEMGSPIPLMTLDDLLEKLNQFPSWQTNMVSPKTAEWSYAAMRVADTPDAVARAIDVLARTMLEVVRAAVFGSGGKQIIWRIMPEVNVWRGSVIEYRDDGPDICPLTDKKCVRDWQHVNVKIYARFAIDDLLPNGTEVFLTKGTPTPPGFRVDREIADDNVIVCVKE